MSDLAAELLQQGSNIEIQGLLGKPELNGQRGTITAPLNAKGRWQVLVDGGAKEIVAIKPGNLVVLTTCAYGPCPTLKPGDKLKPCSRCRRLEYCSKECQAKDWRSGHKHACHAPGECSICLDSEELPVPIQSGCACRGASGFAHVRCKIQVAEHHVPGEWNEAWYMCLTCKQAYTGSMRLRLAHACARQFKGKPAEDDHRLCAEGNLAGVHMVQGRDAEAEALMQEVLAIRQLVFGKDNPATLVVGGNLGTVLRRQGKHSHAEAVFRDVVERRHRVLGAEHKSTLQAAAQLAAALMTQAKYSEAEPLYRQTLAQQQRVLGADHYDTNSTAMNLATLLVHTDRPEEAEPLNRDALARCTRVFGPEHPRTIQAATTLGIIFICMGHTTNGLAMLKDALATAQGALGGNHPATRCAARTFAEAQRELAGYTAANRSLK